MNCVHETLKSTAVCCLLGRSKISEYLQGEKIPYANHCVYVVNIITPTLKARISHKEKLNFCNYPLIKPLLTSHMNLNPSSSNGEVAAQLRPSLHRQGLGIPSLQTQKTLTIPVWVSGSSSALCACAAWPLAGSPLHRSLAREKKIQPFIC